MAKYLGFRTSKERRRCARLGCLRWFWVPSPRSRKVYCSTSCAVGTSRRLQEAR